MASFTGDSKSNAVELKNKGNQLFGAGKFAESEEAYTAAIALDPDEEALFSNRAAARLKLGRPQDALADAEECLRIAPAFMKGYHRKALAQTAMGDETGTYETYLAATRACVSDPWLARETTKAKAAMHRAHAEKPVTSVEQMVVIFGHLEEIWDRLSTLAYFWNVSTPQERHCVFARFLALGRTPDKINDFEVADMKAMTTDNYAAMGKAAKPKWLAFYQALGAAAKVACLEGCWTLTSVPEKEAIIKDLQYFCAPEGSPEHEAGKQALAAMALSKLDLTGTGESP